MRALTLSTLLGAGAVILVLAVPGTGLAKTKTQTFTSGDTAVQFGDIFASGGSAVFAKTTGVQPRNSKIKDVDAAIRLDHPNDGDLRILLEAPLDLGKGLGTDFPESVELSSRNGAGGANYGTGAQSCAGTATVFDDSAPTPITAGVPPFAGTFRPEEPLSSLNREVTKRGKWGLLVGDDEPPGASQDLGTFYCFEVTVTYKVVKKKR